MTGFQNGDQKGESRRTHIVVPIDEVHNMRDDGIASVLRRFAHHPKVQIAQVPVCGGQQVACTGNGINTMGVTEGDSANQKGCEIKKKS